MGEPLEREMRVSPEGSRHRPGPSFHRCHAVPAPLAKRLRAPFSHPCLLPQAATTSWVPTPPPPSFPASTPHDQDRSRFVLPVSSTHTNTLCIITHPTPPLACQVIETTSVWCCLFKHEARRIALVWEDVFAKADQAKRLALVYLANDVLQNRCGEDTATERRHACA